MQLYLQHTLRYTTKLDTRHTSHVYPTRHVSTSRLPFRPYHQCLDLYIERRGPRALHQHLPPHARYHSYSLIATTKISSLISLTAWQMGGVKIGTLCHGVRREKKNPWVKKAFLVSQSSLPRKYASVSIMTCHCQHPGSALTLPHPNDLLYTQWRRRSEGARGDTWKEEIVLPVR